MTISTVVGYYEKTLQKINYDNRNNGANGDVVCSVLCIIAINQLCIVDGSDKLLRTR